ncbi:unnamed protein product [Phytophthora fragariaefolia]|uniref:Unnamed protein product n=1 Tax=Phytophthora fragariaefolia TaxID=1490495 RepID=A0A9W6UDE1_9STRA|nr:unnamed protein product [Phytophthora fragariaefolia]
MCPDSLNKSLNECDRRHDDLSEVNEATQTNLDDSNEESRAPLATPNAEDIDPVTVQTERRRRIAKAQEEELKGANLKAVLRGNSAKLGYKATRDACKVMDQSLSRYERARTTPNDPNDSPAESQGATDDATGAEKRPPPLFEAGTRAWLYMERAKPDSRRNSPIGGTGPSESKEKWKNTRTNSSYRTEVTTGSTQWFTTRLDFDEELLPEDSWGPDQRTGEYEVETIRDDKTPLSTSTERLVRESLVKWVGYDEPTWEPASNLSCGGRLYELSPTQT